MKFGFGEIASFIGQLLAYVLAVILVIQILKFIFGGSWGIEEIILALVIFNLTISFGIGGYLINLNNKISDINTKVEGHFGWHKGVDNKTKDLNRKKR